MTYFLHIAYDGSKYSGWQRQERVPSIQERMEIDLSRILGEEVTVNGCGRTDAGVHASQYFCHIDLYKAPKSDFLFVLNKNLPLEIRVFDVIPMSDKCNARFDVVSRSYDYYLHFYEDPFLDSHSSYFNLNDLDIESMKTAVSILTKYQDFRSLCRRSHLFPDTVCDVSFAKLYVSEDERRMRFSITSNRFLQGMIRIFVHFLIQIGKGKLTAEAFENMLANRDEVKVKRLANPEGLYLSRVIYPYLDLPVKPSFANMLNHGLHELE
ncbi:tRNA pseudouridine38-40 synthase [Spirosomataceae bacterium TFI 002]|nr:tRNA pseudouridine38-40 synthase [Spirosomataceae bacterium TFI 002]